MAWRPPPRASLAGDAFFKRAAHSAGGSATTLSSQTPQRGTQRQSPSAVATTTDAAAAAAAAPFARYAQLCRNAALGGSRGQKHAVAEETTAMVARLRSEERRGGGGGGGVAASPSASLSSPSSSSSPFVDVTPAAAAEALEAQLRLRGDVRGLAPLLVRRLLARTPLPPAEVAATARFVRAAVRLSHAGATVPLIERALEAESGAADAVQLAACLAGTDWKAAVPADVSARLGRRAAASLERADARVWDGCRIDAKALADAAAATTTEEEARLGAWAGRAAAETPFFATPAGKFARQLRAELRRGGEDRAAAVSQLRGAKRLAVAVAVAAASGDGGADAAAAAALCRRVLLAVRVAGAAAAETKGAEDLAAAALRTLAGMLEVVRSSTPSAAANELPAAFGSALRGVAAGLSARRREALAFLGGGVGGGGQLAASNTELRARRQAAEAILVDAAAVLRRARMTWPGAALGAEALAGGVVLPVLPLLAAGAADDGDPAEKDGKDGGEEALLAVLKVLPRLIECFPTRCTAAAAAFATSLPSGVAARHAAACLRLHKALGGDPSRVAPEAAQAWMRRLSPLRSSGAVAAAVAAPRDAARQEELRLWVAAASADEAVEAGLAFAEHLEASGGKCVDGEEGGFGGDTEAETRFVARVVPAAFDALAQAQTSSAEAAAAAARRLVAAVQRALERRGGGGGRPLRLDPYPLWASLGDLRLWRGERNTDAAAAQVALLEHTGCFSLSEPPSAGGGQRSPLDKMLRAWANGVSPPATSLDWRTAHVLARVLPGRGAEAEAAAADAAAPSLVTPEALWALLQGLDTLEVLDEAWVPLRLDSLMRSAAAAAAAPKASVETAVALMRAASAALHAVLPTPYVAVERAVDAAAAALLGALDAGTLVLRTTGAGGGAASRHILALRAALAARGLEDGVVSELSWHCCAADAVALRLVAAGGATGGSQGAVATETAVYRILETYQAYEAHRRVGGGRPAVTRMLQDALAEAAHTHAAVFVDLCLRYFPSLLPGGCSASGGGGGGEGSDDDYPLAAAPPALELPLFLVPAGLAGRGRPVVLPLSLPGSVVPASSDVSVFASDLVMEAAKAIPV